MATVLLTRVNFVYFEKKDDVTVKVCPGADCLWCHMTKTPAVFREEDNIKYRISIKPGISSHFNTIIQTPLSRPQMSSRDAGVLL